MIDSLVDRVIPILLTLISMFEESAVISKTQASVFQFPEISEYWVILLGLLL
jgi:hypothetical protein